MNRADDRLAIEALKYRYVRCLDTKDWDGLASCLAPDLTSNYGGLEFSDRESLLEFLRNSLATILTTHQVHHPEIDFEDDDHATGRWYLYDKVLAPQHDFYLEGAAFYDDTYIRTSDGWMIQHTGYVRTWELTGKLSSLGEVKPPTGP